jgi:hypothetical protein
MESSNTDLQWRLGTYEGNFKADMLVEGGWALTKATANIMLQYPGRIVGWTQTIQHIKDGEYRSDLDIQLDSNTHLVLKSNFKSNPRYELATTAKYANGDPIQFLFFLKPDLRDVQAHVEMRYLQDKYSFETNWKTEGPLGDFTTTGDMDMQIGRRHIVADTSLNSKADTHDLKFSTKWDADADSSKQASLNIKVTTSSQQPKLYMRAECNTYYFIEIDTNAKHETGHWWSEVNDFQGVAKWKSSFAGWETAVINFKHDIKDNGWMTHFEVSKANQKITGDWTVSNKVGWEEAETSLSMKTPFEGYKSVETSGSYKLRRRGLDVATKVMYDGKVIAMILDSQVNPNKHILKVNVNLKTPFAGYEEVTVSFSHDDDGKKFNTGFEYRSASKALQYQQEVTIIPGSMLAVDMKLISPFRGMEKVIISFQNNLKGNSLSGNYKLLINDKTWLVDASGMMEWPTVKVGVTYTPPRGDKKVISLTNEKTGQTWITNSFYKYGETVAFEFNNEFEWGNTKKLNTVVKCELCPYIGTTSVLLEFTGSMSNLRANMELQNTALMTDKITWSTEINVDDMRDMSAKTSLRTPFSMSYVDLAATHKKQGRQFLTSFNGQIPGHSASLDNDLTLRDPTNFVSKTIMKYNGADAQMDMKLNTKDGVNGEATWTVGNSAVGASFGYTGQLRDFQANAQVNINRLTYRTDVTFKLVGNNLNFSADLTIPQFREQVKITHRGNMNNFMSSLELDIDGRKGSAEVSFNMSPLNGAIKITTPWRQYDAMGMTFQYEQSSYSYKPSAEVYWNSKDKITMVSELSMTNRANNIKVAITTPWRQFDTVGLSFQSDVPASKASGDLYWNSREKITMSSEWSMPSRSGMMSKISITTPWQRFDTMGMSFNFEDDSYIFKSSAEVYWNSRDKITVDSELSLPKDGNALKVTVTTPFRGFDTITLDASTGGYWPVFQNEATFSINRDSYEIKNKFSLGKQSFSIDSTVTIPQGTSSFKYSHNGNLASWEGKSELDILGNRGSLNINLQYTEGQIGFSADLSTPFEQARIVSIAYNSTAKSWTNWSTTTTWRFNNMEGDSSTEFKMYGNNLNLLYSSNGPNYKQAFNIRHSGPANDFKTTITLLNGYGKIKYQTEFKMQDYNVDASTTLETPFRGYESSSISIKANGDSKNYEMKLRAVTPYTTNQPLTVKLTWEMRKGFNTELTVSSGFSTFSDLGMNINMEGNPSNFRIMSSAWRMQQKISIETSFKLARDVEGSIKISTPFEPVREMGASFSYNGAPLNFKANGKVYWDQQITADVIFDWQSNKMASIDIVTPFKGFKTLGAQFKLLSGSFDFSGDKVQYQRELVMYWSNRDKIVVTDNLEMNGYKQGQDISADYTLNVKTPFSGYENMGYGYRYEGTWNDMKADYEVYWTEQSRTKVHLEFTHTDDFTKGKADLLVYGMQDMGLSFSNTGRWNDMTTLGEIYWSPESKISMESKFSFQRNFIKQSFSLVTPFSAARTIKTSFERKGEMYDCQNSATIEVNGKRISMTHSLKVEDMNFDFKFETTTPFAGYERIYAKYIHKMPTMSRFTCDGEITVGINTGKLDVNFDITRGKKMASFEVTMPFDYVRSLGASFEHEGQLQYFTNTASVHLNSKKITTTNTFSMSRTSIAATSELSTPFESTKTVVVKYEHELPSRTLFKCNSGLTINGQTSTFIVDYDFTDSLNVMLELTTPLREMRQVKLEFDHVGKTLMNMKSTGAFELNNKRYTGDMSFTINNNKLSTEVNVNIPGYEKMFLGINHDGAWSNFENTARLSLGDGRTNTYIGKFSLNGLDMEGEVRIDLPSAKVGDHKLSFMRRGSWNNLNAKVELSGDQTGRYNTEVSHSHSNDLMTIQTTVTANTPTRNAKLTYNHGGSWNDFSCKLTMECQGKIWENEIVFKNEASQLNIEGKVNTPKWGNYAVMYTNTINRQGYEAQLTVQTPVRGYEQNVASINVISSGTTDSADFVVMIGKETFSVAWKRNDNTRERTESLTVKTPKMVGNPSSYTSYDQFMAELKIARGGNMQFDITVETPFKNLEKMALSVSHMSDMTSSQTTCTMQTSYPNMEKFSLKLNSKNNFPSVLEGSIEMQTPFRNFESFKTGASFYKTENSVEGKTFMDSSFPGFEHFDIDMKGNFTGRELAWDLSMNTPFKGYQTWTAQLKHSGGMDRFDTTATVKTPMQSLPSANIQVSHEGGLKGFTSNAQYNGQRFDIRGSLKINEISLEITTPFDMMRTFEMNAHHNTFKDGSVDISLNGRKKVDFDYSVSFAPSKWDIKISARKPVTMSFNVNMVSSNGQNDLTIDVISPSGRPISLISKYISNSQRLSHDFSVQWERSQNSLASYKLDLSKKTLRSQMTYDGTLAVASPWYTQQASVSHTIIPNAQYTTQLVVEGQQRMMLKNEFINSSPKWKNTFSIQHPQLTKEISVIADGIVDMANFHIEGSLKAVVESEELNFFGKIQDMSTRGEEKVVASMKLTHPSTKLDLSFDADCTSNDNYESHQMTLKYTTSRDRKDIIFSTTTKLDKNSKTFTVEMNTPITAWRLTGTPSIHDRSRGIYEYTWNFQSQTQRIIIQNGLNWEAKEWYSTMTMNDQIMKVLAKYNSKTSMSFTITHEQSGQEVQDVVLAVYPTRKRAINIRKMIRPGCVNELFKFLERQMDTRAMVEGMDNLLDTLKADTRSNSEMFRRRTMPVLKSVGETLFGTAAADALDRLMEKMAKAFDSDKIYNAVHAQLQKVTPAFDKLMKMLDEFVEACCTSLNNAYNKNYQMFDDMYEYTQDKVSSMVDSVQKHPITQKVSNFAPQEWMKNMKESGMQYRESFGKMADGYREYLPVASDVWSNVGRRMEVRQMSDALNQLQNHAQWAYEHYEVEDTMKSLAKQASMSTLMNLKDRTVTYVKGFFIETNVNEWDQGRGVVDVDIELPEEWPTFQMPDIDMKEYIVRLMEWMTAVSDTMSKSEDVSFIGLIYDYLPTSLKPEILPPFGARASIAGGQNFITFDKNFYPYAGDCSYLLTRDFIDGQFAVVINYGQTNGKSVSKSITVSTAKTEMEIFPDGSVIVGGRQMNLPVQYDNVTIRRQGDSLRIDNTNGFSMECNLGRDHCTVTVSGWYYAKTAGMLGTFDNEAATDFMTADGMRTSDVEQFASSWASGRRCTTTNLAKQQTAFPGQPTFDICATFFKSQQSPFLSCFSRVDPKPYMRMCMNAMPARRQEIKHACNIMSMYESECKREGRTINLPKECVRCDHPDGTAFYEGTTIELTGVSVPRSADVVFIVEEARCNSEITNQLSEIVSQFDRTLQETGLTNNRFGLVGYGGYGVHYEANTHSFEGKIMTTSDKVSQSMQSMQMNGESIGDATKAIQMATVYPFRTGVSKTIVLVTCNGCQTRAGSYSWMLQQLKDFDIKLHVLLEHQYEVKGEAKQARTAYLFGHDEEGIFTFKNTQTNLDSDKELNNHVQKPKDICAAAAMETKGTVFSANQLTEGRPDNQQRLVSLISNIWANGATPTKYQKCECVANEYNMARSVCKNGQERNFFLELFGYGQSSESSSEETSSEEITPETMLRRQVQRGDRRKLRNMSQ